MRKKTQKAQQTQEEKQICDDCKYATFVEGDINKDHEGQPIFIQCPENRYYILRGKEACPKLSRRMKT